MSQRYRKTALKSLSAAGLLARERQENNNAQMTLGIGFSMGEIIWRKGESQTKLIWWVTV